MPGQKELRMYYEKSRMNNLNPRRITTPTAPDISVAQIYKQSNCVLGQFSNYKTTKPFCKILQQNLFSWILVPLRRGEWRAWARKVLGSQSNKHTKIKYIKKLDFPCKQSILVQSYSTNQSPDIFPSFVPNLRSKRGISDENQVQNIVKILHF